MKILQSVVLVALLYISNVYAQLEASSPFWGGLKFECFIYDGTPNKNDYHYVTIKPPSATSPNWYWLNVNSEKNGKPGWTISPTMKGDPLYLKNFQVLDGPYQDFKRAKIVYGDDGSVTGILGPGKEEYTLVPYFSFEEPPMPTMAAATAMPSTSVFDFTEPGAESVGMKESWKFTSAQGVTIQTAEGDNGYTKMSRMISTFEDYFSYALDTTNMAAADTVQTCENSSQCGTSPYDHKCCMSGTMTDMNTGDIQTMYRCMNMAVVKSNFDMILGDMSVTMKCQDMDEESKQSLMAMMESMMNSMFGGAKQIAIGAVATGVAAACFF